jgi:hypothetical protein
VASTLLSRGDVNFDAKTLTKTIETLLVGLESQALLKYTQWLAEALQESSGVKEDALEDSGSSWAVEALFALMKNPDVESSSEVAMQVTRLLLSLAYFDTQRVKSKAPKGTSRADGAAWTVVKGDVSEVGLSEPREKTECLPLNISTLGRKLGL